MGYFDLVRVCKGEAALASQQPEPDLCSALQLKLSVYYNSFRTRR